MLRATIEIVPYGEEEHKKTIFTLNISNMGVVRREGFGHDICRYNVLVLDDEGEPITGEIIQEHDRRDGAIALVQKACAIVEDRV